MTRGELDHETRATGRLPGVDIEVLHRPAAQGRGEQISIQLTASSSFETFSRAMQTADPFTFWAETLQLAWMPWVEAMRTLSTPWMQFSRDTALTPSRSGSRSQPELLPESSPESLPK